mgnify:CR=1 FL=1
MNPIQIAILREDAKQRGCGKNKVGRNGRCVSAKTSQATGSARWVEKPKDYSKKANFNHRTAKESGASKAEKIAWPLAIGAGALGVAGLAAGGIYLASRGSSGGANVPIPETEGKESPSVIVTEAPVTPSGLIAPTKRKKALPKAREKTATHALLKRLVEHKGKHPAVEGSENKGLAPLVVTAPIPKGEKKARKKLIERLLSLPAAGETTEMPLSEHSEVIYSHHLLPSEQTKLGKPGGRRSKETKEFESKPGHYRSMPVKGARFKPKDPSPKVERSLSQIPGKLTSNDKEHRRMRRKSVAKNRRGLFDPV